jgi:hypothetical protein
MTGRVFGLPLSLEEAVTERDPPHRKVWETIGRPQLLVIGNYRMGFEIKPQGTGSLLRVFIDYTLPKARPARWLGRLFSQYYARWSATPPWRGRPTLRVLIPACAAACWATIFT